MPKLNDEQEIFGSGWNRKARAFSALCLALIASAVCVITVKKALYADPEPAASLQSQQMYAAEMPSRSSSALPGQLVIPAIKVNAHIQYVGVSRHNTIAVPTNYTDVAWYRYSAVPGQAGLAIIDGHKDNGFGLSAVLMNLIDLKKGNQIYIQDTAGQTMKFLVLATSTLGEASSTADLFHFSKDKSMLAIITCEGQWMPEQKMYSDRLIVFAEYAGTSTVDNNR